MITLQNVSLTYDDKQVLDNFTQTIPTDQITCLFGPSGSGKTTLLHLLAGLVVPQSGEITGLPKKPALLFQEDRLIPHLTAEANIAAVLPKDRKHEAMDWLRRVGLESDAHLRPSALSGGMRRRIALARTLAFGGDFLLLDEPFTGLDFALTEQMATLIRETNTGALIITHSPDEITLLDAQTLKVEGIPLRVCP